MTNEEIIAKTKEEIRLRGLSPDTEIEHQNFLRFFEEWEYTFPIASAKFPAVKFNDSYPTLRPEPLRFGAFCRRKLG